MSNLKMKVLLFVSCLVLCLAIIESRYPYEDTYRPGDIVPNANGRRVGDGDLRSGRGRGGYDGGLVGHRRRDGQGGGLAGPRRRDGYERPGPYDEHLPSDVYLPSRTNRRGQRNNGGYLRPRGLGGYKKSYGDYDYGKYRRSYPRGRPSLYSNDDFNYGDYSDVDSRYD